MGTEYLSAVSYYAHVLREDGIVKRLDVTLVNTLDRTLGREKKATMK